jgi:hypothetical protein
MSALSADDFPPGPSEAEPAGTVPAAALLDMLGSRR